jgi:hypothetical protein
LQAADLVAWEFYQFAKENLEGELSLPSRLQFRRLTSNMNFQAQIARREAIKKIAELANSKDNLSSLADHFRTFDPDASAVER